MLSTCNQLASRVLLILGLSLTCQQTLAAVFPIDIERDLNGLKIIDRANTIEAGPSVVLTLSNLDTREASCRVSFDPRIEQRKTKKRNIAPGQTSSIHYAPGRQVNRLSIRIVCKPM